LLKTIRSHSSFARLKFKITPTLCPVILK
jgi:hypothetical protein